MAEEQQNEAGAAAPQGQNGQGAGQQFALQRVYLKDLSFESPDAPAVFRKEYKPAVNVDLRTRSNSFDTDLYEVVLTITITAKIQEETAFLVEVQQAGIFAIRGLEGEALRQVLSIFCPTMLFPYAREVIDNTVVKGTFPALMLAQVNFEALYSQAVQQAQQKAAEQAETTAAPEAGD
jgi:preprotein translocase subunit SecB